LVVWRSHIGCDVPNDRSERGWDFLRPYLADVDAYIFTRKEYAPGWIDPARLRVIPPSLDPFSPKNADLAPAVVRDVLGFAGLIGGFDSEATVSFARRDGTTGRLDRHADVLQTGPPPPADVPLVVQVSRWDRLKDMHGVMEAFAEHVDATTHLVLAGPNVSGVADDPEGAEVLEECMAAWRALAHADRSRVHLACLPTKDLDENAIMVNALQRHATVVVQKSLAEGFGLTVAEAMWKGRLCRGRRGGGGGGGAIVDQVVHGESGLLVDPTDGRAFGQAVGDLLANPGEAARLGGNARRRALEMFLGDRHLAQYAEMIAQLFAASR
jgi:trehalose synthase